MISFEPVVIALREALSWVSESRAISIPLEEHAHQVRTAAINDRELLHSALVRNRPYLYGRGFALVRQP
jgi:type VI secretion system protein ImpJ